MGTSIGLPLGGVLYGQLGWKAPSVFALVLIGLDFALRVCVLEKHEVKRWLDASAEEDARSQHISASSQNVDQDRKDGTTTEAQDAARPRRSSIEQGRERMDHDIALVPLAAGIDPVEIDHAESKETPAPAPKSAPSATEAEEAKGVEKPERQFNALGGIAYLLFRPQPLTGYLVSFLSTFVRLWVQTVADQTSSIASQTV